MLPARVFAGLGIKTEYEGNLSMALDHNHSAAVNKIVEVFAHSDEGKALRARKPLPSRDEMWDQAVNWSRKHVTAGSKEAEALLPYAQKIKDIFNDPAMMDEAKKLAYEDFLKTKVREREDDENKARGQQQGKPAAEGAGKKDEPAKDEGPFGFIKKIFNDFQHGGIGALVAGAAAYFISGGNFLITLAVAVVGFVIGHAGDTNHDAATASAPNAGLPGKRVAQGSGQGQSQNTGAGAATGQREHGGHAGKANKNKKGAKKPHKNDEESVQQPHSIDDQWEHKHGKDEKHPHSKKHHAESETINVPEGVKNLTLNLPEDTKVEIHQHGKKATDAGMGPKPEDGGHDGGAPKSTPKGKITPRQGPDMTC